ncbi:MAG: GntR family transcriptional regulator [Bacteroidales bacterium]|nr:GntR family transcriptional regulator [Bacteroidales bacterium]
MKFTINTNGKDPIYKQLVNQVERGLHNGKLAVNEQLPSMNELAAELHISRETAKKAYGILTEKGLLLPRQGRGFFTQDPASSSRSQVLVIFDKFSVYKQILFNAFAERLGKNAEITILNHNQSIDLFEYYLDNNLDSFDYYVVAPHFPLNTKTQKRVEKQLNRIPFRKMIMLDRLQPDMNGHFGAVYQDFENDVYEGLSQGLSSGGRIEKLRVITLPKSLYGPHIHKGIERFAADHDIPVEFLSEAPDNIKPHDTFLVLNSQLDAGLVGLVRKIKASGLQVGQDVNIISYNEFDMNELVLGGLTTISTDFRMMGQTAAEMILNRQMQKVHCPFGMYKRSTF